MLTIKNLSKTYNRRVLHDVSLTVKEGEIAFLLGSSGVGKSTLLRVLSGLEQPDSGTITYNGAPLTDKHAAVGMVFQQFNLFENMSVERNITFALEKVANLTPEEAKKRAYTLLEKYGLLDKAALSVHKLSGGQKQRLAIARTIAMKPHILCLDEPTSALDPLLTNSVAQAIQDLAREKYVVLVASHDTALLKHVDCTIYLMHQGTIVETAPSKAFFQHEEKFPRIKEFVHG